MIFIIITILLFLSYAILMLVYRRGWIRYSMPLHETFPNSAQKISIIIPARNEADNIGKCLHSILSNEFPAAYFEIIVIDDFSEDETASVAGKILNNKNGRVIALKDYLSKDERINAYKKKALEIAIIIASGDWIITTDADCIAPKNWLKQMHRAMQNEHTQFIAAPVSFIPFSRRNWLYYFQSLDFMTMQGITAASIANNMGNMCNGANLAFRKSAFNEVGGYKDIDHIASGDDMLLMHKIQSKYPDGIYYLKSEQAIVETPVQANWKAFLNQRIRWSSKADKYNDKKLTAVLALVYLFNFNILVLVIASVWNYNLVFLLFGTVFAKVIVELLFLIPVAKFYGKSNEMIYFTVLQPIHILYIVMAGFLGKFGKYDWKGRTVK
ncbi:glycosyltransferase [Taibaiella lutea]|uniref:Glycosyltransferase n=1 Tax=Taibaiella lutea TaxID=2608001 RepID=A0A5M6CSZ7_9BACT|nr:glycosyltransferase [Taibaiella lutea]KAA5536279.1 glycosyltransferase [Taibaiella lutea]